MTVRLAVAALQLAARGLAVFPCRPGGKEPLTAHGFKDASAAPDQLRRWWTRWPAANLGVAAGAASGVVVVDVDPRHGGDATLAGLVARLGPLPPTWQAVTGGDGEHIYLRHPDGPPVRCRSLGGGVDLKSAGGYVIAPPSRHPSGRRYRWAPRRAPWEQALADVPEPWLPLLAPAERPPAPAVVAGPLRPLRGGDRARRYAAAALARACADAAAARPGSRHVTLNAVAFACGRFVGGGLLDEAEARAALEAAGRASGLPAREVARTVADALAAGALHPRSLPEEPPGARPRPVPALTWTIAGRPVTPAAPDLSRTRLVGVAR